MKQLRLWVSFGFGALIISFSNSLKFTAESMIFEEQLIGFYKPAVLILGVKVRLWQ